MPACIKTSIGCMQRRQYSLFDIIEKPSQHTVPTSLCLMVSAFIFHYTYFCLIMISTTDMTIEKKPNAITFASITAISQLTFKNARNFSI